MQLHHNHQLKLAMSITNRMLNKQRVLHLETVLKKKARLVAVQVDVRHPQRIHTRCPKLLRTDTTTVKIWTASIVAYGLGMDMEVRLIDLQPLLQRCI